METNNYASYNNMVATVSNCISQLEGACEKLELDEIKKQLAAGKEKLKNHKFSVGILGEFKRGKSMVINSLLEEEVLPSDIMPATATMNRVTYDLNKHAQLLMKDGSVRNVEVENLKDYVTKITKNSEANAEKIEEAIVYYPCPFCQNDVDIIDTPGLNDDERMNSITENVIPKLDAVIMVLVHGSPFSASEAEFVRTKLMTSDLGRIIFLVNKIDTVRRASDIERVIDEIRERIRETVLERMAEVHGENSEEYEQMRAKLGNIKIFPFSAYDAFDGKKNHDPELIKKSGTIEFEKELTKMLTEDRGALEISGPLTLISRSAAAVTNTAVQKKEAFEMDKEELERRHAETLEAIKKAREEKVQEKKRIKALSVETKNSCAEMLNEYYEDLKKKLTAAVDEKFHEIDAKKIAFKEKEIKENLSQIIKSTSEEQMSIFSEKILVKLKNDISADFGSSNEFLKSINDSVNVAVGDKDSNKTDLIGIGIDVLTDFIGINGLGGIISGFKAAGVKGAVVGGGIGLAANLAVWAVLAPIGIPAVVISCAAGSIVSKFSSKLIFSGTQLQKLKDATYQSIDTMLKDIKNSRELDNWVDTTVTNAYTEYADIVERECESYLTETQQTIDSIKSDMSQNEFERKQTIIECDQVLEIIENVKNEIEPITRKIRSLSKQETEAVAV